MDAFLSKHKRRIAGALCMNGHEWFPMSKCIANLYRYAENLP
jgi:hypothetical protein